MKDHGTDIHPTEKDDTLDSDLLLLREAVATKEAEKRQLLEA